MTAPALARPLAKLDLDHEIRVLKQARNAILLAHYYQDSEIQDLADVVGDSLELARRAQQAKASVIVFAGVHFMAETAKILNPQARVLVPDMKAGCSLADGCPVDKFVAWKARHPGALTLSYINCSAAVKAESDCIVTSSNAVSIVQAMPKDRPLLFAPDRNLGRYLIKKTGRDMLLWPGTCIVHETFSQRKLLALQMQHPGAAIIAHPECEEPILDMAEFIGSTAALLRYVEQSPKTHFIVVTEPGILHQMKRRCPDKTLIAAPPNNNCHCNECPFMRLNTPEKIYLALRDLQPELQMTEELRQRAAKPILKMLELS